MLDEANTSLASNILPLVEHFAGKHFANAPQFLLVQDIAPLLREQAIEQLHMQGVVFANEAVRHGYIEWMLKRTAQRRMASVGIALYAQSNGDTRVELTANDLAQLSWDMAYQGSIYLLRQNFAAMFAEDRGRDRVDRFVAKQIVSGAFAKQISSQVVSALQLEVPVRAHEYTELVRVGRYSQLQACVYEQHIAALQQRLMPRASELLFASQTTRQLAGITTAKGFAHSTHTQCAQCAARSVQRTVCVLMF